MITYYIRLIEVKSVSQLQSALGRAMHELDEFARSAIINQIWFAAAKNVLHGDDGISPGKYGNGYFFVVDKRLVMRFWPISDMVVSG